MVGRISQNIITPCCLGAGEGVVAGDRSATYIQTGSWFYSYSPLHYFTRPRGTVAVTDTPQRLSTDPGAYQSQAQPFIFGFLRLFEKKLKYFEKV